MKVKFANRIYEVLFTKELAGLTMYAVEDEPNHIDWLINVDVVDAEKKELKKIEQKSTEEYNITGIGSKHAQGKLAEMIKNLKPVNKALEQKFANKIEPKFKIGDWVVFNNKHQSIYQVEKIEDGYYILRHTHGGTFRVCVLHNESLRLWTIQDAKPGDVLVCIGKYGQEIGIIKEYVGKYGGCDKCFETYCFVDWDGIFRTGEYMGSKEIHPATKEQRDTLMKAMTDAGYTFDFKEKELKKIDNEIEIPFGAKDSELQEVTYYIPKGFNAEINDDKVVIKKGEKPIAWSEEDEKIYQSIMDDTVQENQLNGEQTNWLRDIKYRYFPQPKQDWSKEDEAHIDSLLKRLEGIRKPGAGFISTRFTISEDKDWLKSLKNKVQHQPKQEWSEEDVRNIQDIDSVLFYDKSLPEDTCMRLRNWLKSLRPQINVTDKELAQAKKDAYNDALDKIEYHNGEPTFNDGWSAAIWYLKKRNAQPQNTWKPSDEQMEALDRAQAELCSTEYNKPICDLIDSLNKLREE